jgi:hypothetical protein
VGGDMFGVEAGDELLSEEEEMSVIGLFKRW